MSERRECFCGRRIVFEFGLTDDDGNAHTWRFCGKDDDGQGLDVNTLLSEQMEAHERVWQAEAAIQRAMDYCNQRRDDKGGDLTALNVIRLLKGTPIVGGQ